MILGTDPPKYTLRERDPLVHQGLRESTFLRPTSLKHTTNALPSTTVNTMGIAKLILILHAMDLEAVLGPSGKANVKPLLPMIEGNDVDRRLPSYDPGHY